MGKRAAGGATPGFPQADNITTRIRGMRNFIVKNTITQQKELSKNCFFRREVEK